MLRDVPVDGEPDLVRVNTSKHFYLLDQDDREFDFRWTTVERVPDDLRNPELHWPDDGAGSYDVASGHTPAGRRTRARSEHGAESSDGSPEDVEVDGNVEFDED